MGPGTSAQRTQLHATEDQKAAEEQAKERLNEATGSAPEGHPPKNGETFPGEVGWKPTASFRDHEITYWGEGKQCKYMVHFRDFP